jgi:hypothetical protein
MQHCGDTNMSEGSRMGHVIYADGPLYWIETQTP